MDNQQQALVKYDINFFEYPNWTLSDTRKKKIIIQREHGTYTLSTSLIFPSRADCLVHYFLLSKAFDKKRRRYREKVKTTRYEISKNALNTTNPFAYKRIVESISRWTAIYIKFEGTFYQGRSYTTKGFHFIEGYELNPETGQLTIRFNKDYIDWLNHTEYFKFFDFKEIKKLRRPVSTRLYELLVKTFKDRFKWQIDIVSLAEKLTLEKRQYAKDYYPSDVIIKLKPAINEINKRTELQVDFNYDLESRLCTFTKLESKESEQTKELKSLLKLLPISLNRQKSVKELLLKYLNKKDYHYVESNIVYSKENAQDNLKAYLKKSLKHDWGEEQRAKEIEIEEIKIQKEAEQKLKEEQIKKEEEERKKEEERKIHIEQWKLTADQNLLKRIKEQATQEIEKQVQVSAGSRNLLLPLIALQENKIIEKEYL